MFPARIRTEGTTGNATGEPHVKPTMYHENLSRLVARKPRILTLHREPTRVRLPGNERAIAASRRIHPAELGLKPAADRMTPAAFRPGKRRSILHQAREEQPLRSPLRIADKSRSTWPSAMSTLPGEMPRSRTLSGSIRARESGVANCPGDTEND